ncbi:MAG: glutamyl-tRNA reductase [Parachlamydiales bacterium]|jgi:glutamyl-tRNA reductase
MRVGVLGINHKLASLSLREAIAAACNKYFGSEKIVHAGHAFLLLSTCNRTEVYFASEDPAQAHSYILSLLREEVESDFEQKIYSFFGYDCFYHLTRVTAGLDSAILAETEIQGQVKLSYEHATGKSSLPPELHFVFQKSLQIAKQARHTLLNQFSNTSLEQLMWRLCTEQFKESPKILFIGASQVNVKALNYIKRREYGELWICNRTDSKAQEIASQSEISYLPWEERHMWSHSDVVCCATKSPTPLIQGRTPGIATRLFFDLSVPRNIAPEMAELGLLFDIDQLQAMVRKQQSHLGNAVIQAEKLVGNATLCHLKNWQRRDHVRRQLAYA